MMKWIITLGVITSLIWSGSCFAQVDRSAELAKLLAGIESASRIQRVDAAKVVSRSGLQGDELYEKIAEIIEAGYKLPYEKDLADEMAWMCKALAASGDPKYRQLLAEVAQNSPSIKIKKYAKQSAELLDVYAERSKVLNKTDSWDEDLTAEENRLVNMLRSDDTALKRDAAKIIVRSAVNGKVYSVVASALNEMSETYRNDNLSVDTMAWLCKALATSGDNSYVKDLEFVLENTKNSKLRKYAKNAIKDLD